MYMGTFFGLRSPWTMSIWTSVSWTNSPWNVTVSIASSRRTASTTSRIASSGRRRSTPTFDARGSHHAPMPHNTRPGARSSSVENVAAIMAGFRVQLLMTPLPTLMRSVTAAKAAMGTMASLTRRDSACHTASKPRASASRTKVMPSRMGCLSCRYRATRCGLPAMPSSLPLLPQYTGAVDSGGRGDGAASRSVQLRKPFPRDLHFHFIVVADARRIAPLGFHGSKTDADVTALRANVALVRVQVHRSEIQIAEQVTKKCNKSVGTVTMAPEILLPDIDADLPGSGRAVNPVYAHHPDQPVRRFLTNGVTDAVSVGGPVALAHTIFEVLEVPAAGNRPTPVLKEIVLTPAVAPP